MPKTLSKKILVNNKRNTSRIPANMAYMNKSLTSAQEIVDMFAQHFSRVYKPNSDSGCDSASNTSNGDKCAPIITRCNTTNCDVYANVMHTFCVSSNDITKS